ncbi:MAG: GTPase Era [Chitinivibrionales bacterium]|nr:GTPase Era [Chitinivibrionales bacterium]MBD3358551.1 GTPase Era [Chitinivibrionales bacterium]
MTESIEFHSAFVALIGRPNSGKSTLLNTVLGERISIVSSLPQTTQRNLKGIYNGPRHQIVFVDTPGIHEGRHAVNKMMSRQGLALLEDGSVDIVCYLVDLARDFGEEEDVIAGRVERVKVPVCIIFNKADMCVDVDRTRSAFFARYPTLSAHKSVVLTATEPSAREKFLDTLLPMVPPGPKYYPDEDLTDADLRFLAAELVREQVIRATREEVPHAVLVEILQYKEQEGRHQVEVEIHVETKGQKGILIGAGGAVIKKIQHRAQLALSKLADAPARIRCHVKVTPKWRDNDRFLTGMGFRRS